MVVSLPAQRPVAAGDGPRYTNISETKNETASSGVVWGSQRRLRLFSFPAGSDH